MSNDQLTLPRSQGSAVATREGHGQIATLETFALNADVMLVRKGMLQKVMERVMQKGVHYGEIPGCGDKPSLLKPGAEAISSTFQLCPRYDVSKTELQNGHREYEIVCDLLNPAGGFIGSGVGSATTMEGKYRFRKAEQTCPECGKPSIIKGKQQYGGGWICWGKKGGCGAKFPDGDDRIENQNMGQVEHDNPADYYNTVLKMAKKRAFVDAVLTATGASDIFTQDIEDMPETVPGAARANTYEHPQQPQYSGPPEGMDDLPPEYGQPQQRTQQPQQRGPKPITDPQKGKIAGEGKKRGIDLDALCLALTESGSFGRDIMRLTDLSSKEASAVIDWLMAGQLDHLAASAQDAA